MADFALRRTLGEGWTYVAEPRGAFTEYSEQAITGDGEVVELGYVDIVWDYGNRPLTGVEMRQLQNFCIISGSRVPSNIIHVRTKTREVGASGLPVFRIYRAIMHWPDSEILTYKGTQWFTSVVVKFKGIEEIT